MSLSAALPSCGVANLLSTVSAEQKLAAMFGEKAILLLPLYHLHPVPPVIPALGQVGVEAVIGVFVLFSLNYVLH